MRLSILSNTILAVSLLALGACGKRPAARVELAVPPECRILPGPAEADASITVALLDAVDPEHAPDARNAGEQMLFAHLYQTLIAVDCLGEVRAGLAQSWSKGDRGRLWTFELREDARFWDGTPVTARDIARSWQRAAAVPMTLYAIIDSTVVVDDRVLRVYFKHPHRKVPRELSAPAFAAAKPSWYSRWPLGSGPFQIVAPENESAGLSLNTITLRPAFGAKGPEIRFLKTTVRDARDLLGGTIDVLITTHPEVIEYALGQPQLAATPLPWDKTYILLSTSRVEELFWNGAATKISPDLFEGLARDAVRSDARGHLSPSWWNDVDGCHDLSAAVPGLPPVPRGAYLSSGSRRVLYDMNDPTARDLAERIVALASTDSTTSPEAAAITAAVPRLIIGASSVIAEGVTRVELNLSLKDGSDFAYVVSVPRQPSDPCYEARTLINRAQWIANVEDDFSKIPIPLVDTRPHVVTKRDRIGLVVDWYGNVLIVNGMLPGI